MDSELELLELEAEALKLKLMLLKLEPGLPALEYPERQGDVSKEQLKKTFGLRSIKVSTDLSDGDVQDLMNISYDTFRHLAMVIEQPMTAVGLGGNLALNIGIHQMNRNTGGCYSPDIISLQFKTNDDFRHIAHEWLHAFDHYLWYTFGETKKVSQNRYSLMSERNLWQTDSAVKKCLWDLLVKVYESNYYQRSKATAQLAADDYWISNPELLARAFEIYAVERMTQLNIVDSRLVSLFANNPYPFFKKSADKPIQDSFEKLWKALKMKDNNYEIKSLGINV